MKKISILYYKKSAFGIMSSNDSSQSYKVVLVGSSGVGKTSIVHQLLQGSQPVETTPTIGVEFKMYAYSDVKLQLWDTAGQERFRSVSKAYFRNAVGALICYDITNRQSFEDLQGWISDINELAVANAYIVLVGNKSDLEDKRVVSESEAEEFATRNKLTRIETSAKNGDGIQEAFARLKDGIIRNEKEGKLVPQRSAANTTTDVGSTQTKSSNCC